MFPDYIFGIYGGYVDIKGGYDSQLSSGNKYRLSFAHLLLPKSLYLDYDLAYSYYGLSESDKSKLVCASFAIGPYIFLNHNRHYNIFTGLKISANYLELKTNLTDKIEKAYKPGLELSLGVNSFVYQDMAVSLKCDYKILELSSKTFHEVSYSIGAVYAFESKARIRKEREKKQQRISKLNKIYKTALNYYNSGNLQEAKVKFEEVIKIDRYFRNCEDYLDQINDIEKIYNESLLLIDENKYIAAIQKLETISSKYQQADRTLSSVRNKIKPKVKQLMINAVYMYENSKYNESAKILKQILIIDPENTKAKVYLQKANTRIEAIEKLK